MTIVRTEEEFTEAIKIAMSSSRPCTRYAGGRYFRDVDKEVKLAMRDELGKPKSYPCAVEIEDVWVESDMHSGGGYHELKGTIMTLPELKTLVAEMETA